MRRTAPLLLVLLLACGNAATTDPGAQGTVLPRCRARGIAAVGETIPFDCRFRTLSGGQVTLADLKGTPTVLNFWASWCSSCIKEMPDFERVHKQLGDRVRFLGANLLGVQSETEAFAKRFAERTGVTYDSLLDEGGLLYAHFAPRLLPPTTILIDASGVVRHRRFGEMTADELRDAISEHLGVA